MRRGEVWWANLPPPVGKRPVVLVSRERAILARSAVTVAIVTSTIRNLPVEVPLGPAEGLPKPCVMNADVLNTIPKKWLTSRLSQLGDRKIQEINHALNFALGLDEEVHPMDS